MTNLFNDFFLDDSCTINSLFTSNIPLPPFISNDEFSQLNNFSENYENDLGNEKPLKNNNLPEQYTFEKIKKDIFPLFVQTDIQKYFQKNDNIINLEKKMSDETYKQPKKRKRGVKLSKEDKKKPGRKKKEDYSFSKHNKNTPDNIIKKIKTNILKYLLIFINKLLYSILDRNTIESCLIQINRSIYEEKEEVDLIKYLDYKLFIDSMKKDLNIKFLKMTINDFLSNKVSTKFKNINEDTNKTIIKDLLKQNNAIFNFIFNLKLGDWFNIFLYKKEIEDFGIIHGNQIKIIMDSFQRVDKLLVNICKKYKNDYDYVSSFICHMYNFERWFLIKTGRNKSRIKLFITQK
jgi:hypothetical protein